jgi:polar amino acid transport system substrate-binding protein
MRRFSFMVLATLLLATLAACGGGTGTTSTATTAPLTEATVAAPTTAPAETIAPMETMEAMETTTMESMETMEPMETATMDAMETSAAATADPGQTEGGASEGLPDLGGRTVVIGTDAAYPPFESVDPATNEIVGFDVDLMNAIAELINIQPQFQNAAFDTIFVALQQGQYDAVMSAATITEERQQIVAFSDPYIEVGQLVVTTADNTTITSYENLASAAAVGVQTGTTGETAALEEGGVPDANLRRYATIDLAFADLANNSIDAVVADGPTVGNYVSQPQYADRLKIVGEAFTTESYGIAVQQDDTELLNAINAALVQLDSDGTIQQLRDKYQIK